MLSVFINHSYCCYSYMRLNGYIFHREYTYNDIYFTVTKHNTIYKDNNGYIEGVFSDDTSTELVRVFPFDLILGSGTAPNYYCYDFPAIAETHCVDYSISDSCDGVYTSIYDAPPVVLNVDIYRRYKYIQISDGYEYTMDGTLYHYSITLSSSGLELTLLSTEEIYKTPDGQIRED